MIFGLVVVALGGFWLWKLLNETDEAKRIKNKKWVIIAGILTGLGALMLSVFAFYPFVFIGGFAVIAFGCLRLLQHFREKDPEKREEKKRFLRISQLILIAGGIITLSSFSPLPYVLAIGLALVAVGGLCFWLHKKKTEPEAETEGFIKKYGKFSPYVLGVGALVMLLSFSPLVLDMTSSPEPVEVAAVATPQPEPTPTPTPRPTLTPEEEIVRRYFSDRFTLLTEDNLFSGVTVRAVDSIYGIHDDGVVLGFDDDGTNILFFCPSSDEETWYPVEVFLANTFDFENGEEYHFRTVRIDDPAILAGERDIVQQDDDEEPEEISLASDNAPPGYVLATRENLFSGVRLYWTSSATQPPDKTDPPTIVVAWGAEGGLMEDRVLVDWGWWEHYSAIIGEDMPGIIVIEENDPALTRAERTVQTTELDDFRRIITTGSDSDISRTALARAPLRVYIWNQTDGSVHLGGTVLERVGSLRVLFWDITLETSEVGIDWLYNNFVVPR